MSEAVTLGLVVGVGDVVRKDCLQRWAESLEAGDHFTLAWTSPACRATSASSPAIRRSYSAAEGALPAMYRLSRSPRAIPAYMEEFLRIAASAGGQLNTYAGGHPLLSRAQLVQNSSDQSLPTPERARDGGLGEIW